jgi:hypothetical protein
MSQFRMSLLGNHVESQGISLKTSFWIHSSRFSFCDTVLGTSIQTHSRVICPALVLMLTFPRSVPRSVPCVNSPRWLNARLITHLTKLMIATLSITSFAQWDAESQAQNNVSLAVSVSVEPFARGYAMLLPPLKMDSSTITCLSVADSPFSEPVTFSELVNALTTMLFGGNSEFPGKFNPRAFLMSNESRPWLISHLWMGSTSLWLSIGKLAKLGGISVLRKNEDWTWFNNTRDRISDLGPLSLEVRKGPP